MVILKKNVIIKMENINGLYKEYRDNSLDGKIFVECNYKDGKKEWII